MRRFSPPCNPLLPQHKYTTHVLTKTLILVTPDNRELWVETAGNPSGKAFLFHNGTPTSRRLFPGMVEEAIDRGIFLICYDRPGYGGSTPNPGRTVGDSAQDVLTITRHFGIERLAVWGISGGGPHTIASALLLPQLVCAAATFSSLAPVTLSNFDYLQGMSERKIKARKLYSSDPDEFRRYLIESSEDIKAATNEIIAEKIKAMPLEARVSQAFYEFSYETMHIAIEKGIEGYWEDYQAFYSDWGFDLSNNEVPIQLWHGMKDSDVPFQHSERLSEEIPNSELHLSQTDGHFSILENHRVEAMEWLLKFD